MDKIAERITVLEKKLGFSANKLGLKAGLGNGTVLLWLDKPVDFSSDKVDQFIEYWEINPVWWASGEGDIFIKDSERADKISLYERLLKESTESKETAVRDKEDWKKQSEKWEAEASKLVSMLEITLRSKFGGLQNGD
ncbi:MAG TPA: hypothetical protein VD927_06270 [Chryseosolibacter sp.]|nr:hypothetical protein [Chryseosolibacter sp.]